MPPAPAPAWRRRPAPPAPATHGRTPAHDCDQRQQQRDEEAEADARRRSPLRQQLQPRRRLGASPCPPCSPAGGNLDPAVHALLAFLHDREIDRLAGFELVGERAREHELVVDRRRRACRRTTRPRSRLRSPWRRAASQGLAYSPLTMSSFQPGFGIGLTAMTPAGMRTRIAVVAEPSQPCGTRSTAL